jgi:hypothetical protein
LGWDHRDVSDDDSAPGEVAYYVDVRVPLLAPEARDRLVAALHQGDRRLGVRVGHVDGGTRLVLVTPEGDDHAARVRAMALLGEAPERVGLADVIAGHAEIQHVDRRKLSPGRPRPGCAPAGVPFRRIALRDGAVLCASQEGPLGRWTVHLQGAEDRAWSGCSLLAVLSELFELPWEKKDDWVYEIIRELAGRETSVGTRYACPCCDCYTLDEPPPGTFALCPVCWWEDDNIQFADPDYRGGANKDSLREARESYRRIGVSKERHRLRARAPSPEELP